MSNTEVFQEAINHGPELPPRVARAMGNRFYYSNTPCKRGHRAAKFTSDRSCSVCAAIKSKNKSGESYKKALNNFHSIEGEEWKGVPVEGFDHLYSVSSRGRVWSNPRPRLSKSGNIYYSKGKMMTNSLDKYGYHIVGLTSEFSGKAKTCKVHRLVAQAFIPNDNFENLTVNHKDSNKINNDVDNLEWMTALENYYHALDLGLIPKKVRLSGFSEEDKEYILKNTVPGSCDFGFQAMSEKFGVNTSTIERFYKEFSDG